MACYSVFDVRCISSDLQAEEGFYFVGEDLSGFLKQKFMQLVGDHRPYQQDVEVVMGRTLHVCILPEMTSGWL